MMQHFITCYFGGIEIPEMLGAFQYVAKYFGMDPG
jgi:hypothetical protein